MNLRSCLAAVVAVAIGAGCGSASSSKAAPGSAAGPRSSSASTSASASASAAAGPATAGSSAQASASASASASALAAAATGSSATPAPTSAVPVAVGGGSRGDFCKTISLTEGILTTAATVPHDPTLPQLMQRLHALAATAPAAIRSDLAAIADFDQKIVDGFASGKPPAIAETPELKAAMLHEALWVQKNCA